MAGGGGVGRSAEVRGQRVASYARLRMGPAPPPGVSPPLYSQDGKNTFMGAMRYVCLPDTVDPRGPKGK
jgi:hypothetical protein